MGWYFSSAEARATLLRRVGVERRAEAVKDALADRGIDSSRVQTRGYSESFPVTTNDSMAGRQLNRRVEWMISKEGESRRATLNSFDDAVRANSEGESERSPPWRGVKRAVVCGRERIRVRRFGFQASHYHRAGAGYLP